MKINSTFWLNYLRPSYYFENISEINVKKLYQDGIRVIICDLDNTLTPHFSNNPLKITINFINQVKALGIEFYIFSNNREKRVNNFVSKLKKFCQIDGYISNSKKPFLSKTKKLIKSNGIKLNEVMVIGDQFITDIFIANRLHVKSILVNPLFDVTIGNSNFLQKMIEKYIYKNLRQNILVADKEREDSELL